jgi:hypothetical protein
MKLSQALFTALFILTSLTALADAGFSIRRRTAPSQITFEGTSRLNGYKLVLVHYSYRAEDTLLKNPFISRRDTIDDGYKIVIQDGGKRWDESERYLHFALAKTDSSGTVTDTFTVYMKKWNYHLLITGEKGGKLEYKMKRSKAYFDYTVIADNEPGNNSKVNRWIFILCSLTGFVLLILLFLKRKTIKPA